MAPLFNKLGNGASEPLRPRDPTSSSPTTCTMSSGGGGSSSGSVAASRKTSPRRFLAMNSAFGDLVADADDADGGRDDSEDDEEVLGRSYTKGE